MISRRNFVALVVGAVALAACSNDGKDETFTEPASADSVPSPVVDVVEVAAADQGAVDATVEGPGTAVSGPDLNSDLSGGVVEYDDADRNAAAETADADLTSEQIDSLIDSYDEFLVGADAVWLEGPAGDPELVEDGLVDLQLSAFERSTASELDEIEAVQSFSNIEWISGSIEAGVVIEDCMESSITNALFIVSPDFVRQRVTFEPLGGDWLVTAVDVVHDGQRTSLDELGCVPEIYAVQAEAVTEGFLRLEAESMAEPDSDLAAMRDVTTPEFFDAVTSGTASPGTVGDPIDVDDIVVETIGHVTLEGPRTLHVGVCWSSGEGADATTHYQDYEVTRGLADGFPDFGDGRDVYAVSGRSPAERVDACLVGSGS